MGLGDVPPVPVIAGTFSIVELAPGLRGQEVTFRVLLPRKTESSDSACGSGRLAIVPFASACIASPRLSTRSCLEASWRVPGMPESHCTI